MRTLLIDDLRTTEFVNTRWKVTVTDVARTYPEGIEALKAGDIHTLLLDHDLACFENGREWTGYDIMLFLEENPRYLPGRIVLVTDNPVGRAKMQTVINKLYSKVNF